VTAIKHPIHHIYPPSFLYILQFLLSSSGAHSKRMINDQKYSLSIHLKLTLLLFVLINPFLFLSLSLKKENIYLGIPFHDWPAEDGSIWNAFLEWYRQYKVYRVYNFSTEIKDFSTFYQRYSTKSPGAQRALQSLITVQKKHSWCMVVVVGVTAFA
jgi:hypothetical protein